MKTNAGDQTTFCSVNPRVECVSATRGPKAHSERPHIFTELHSSPFFEVQAPSRLFSFALFFDEDNGDQLAAACRLADEIGCPGPPPGARYFTFGNDLFTVYWSLHTEFARYTFVHAWDAQSPLSTIGTERAVPEAWFRTLHGKIISAVQFAIASGEYAHWDTLRETWFGANHLIGGEIGDGLGKVFTDYQLHPSELIDGGATRYVVFDCLMGSRQTGRMVQRLIEIDAYLPLSLLPLPLAKRQMVNLDVLGIELRKLTGLTEHEELRDEGLLKQLENLAAELEGLIAESQYRFSASHAYYSIVESQVTDLEMRPVAGIQPLKQFIWRRFRPAMMTCATVERRQDRLAQRVQRTTALLRTRVEVTHEKQNRELLAGMARRAELQLRLQETVEGLSIWVLTYYAVALLVHVLNALEVFGFRVHAEAIAGASVPPVAFLFWLCTRAAKKRYRKLHVGAPDQEKMLHIS